MDFIQNLSISHMYIGNIIIANHISINISYNILSALHGSFSLTLTTTPLDVGIVISIMFSHVIIWLKSASHTGW